MEMNVESNRREETSVVEKIQLEKAIEKNMQEQQGKKIKCWSPWSGSEFSGFEDDQEEYSRINEKCKKLKSWIDIYDNVLSSNVSDINLSTNDRDEESAALENVYTFSGISFPEGENNKGNKYTPMSMIRCKSINDLLENSKSVSNHINDKQTTTNINIKSSHNNDFLALSKSSKDIIVLNKDHIAFIRNEKSVTTSTDASKSHISVANSTIGNSYTIPNQRSTHVSSKFNHKTSIPNILNTDRQFPTPPMMSMYNNHPMSIMNMNSPPFMYDAMLSCSNYMQQGMNSSLGMNSFPVPDPLNKSQPPTSFIFNNFNSPITLSHFPNEIMENNPFRISNSSIPPVISMNGGSNLMSSIGSGVSSINTPITNTSTATLNLNNVNAYIGHNLSAIACDKQKGAYKRKINDSISFTFPHDSQKSKSSSTTSSFACKYCSYTFVNQELFNKHFQDGLCSRLGIKTGNNNKTAISNNENEKRNSIKRFLYACYICDKSFDEKELSLHLEEIHNIRHSISILKKNYPYTSVIGDTENLNQMTNKSSLNNNIVVSGTPIVETCVSDTTSAEQTNCSRYVAKSSLQPTASTSEVSSSLSTISTLSCNFTPISSRSQVDKCKSTCSPSLNNSSFSSPLTSSNVIEFSANESNQQTARDKTISHVATSESNTGSSINCPGCSFTFMGDDLFSQHLKAGLCSKLLTDIMSKKFTGYTVCNIKKKELDKSSEKQSELTGKQNVSSEKHTESTGKQNGSPEKHNESTGKQNLSSEKKNLSSEKHNESTGKKNELTGKNNVSSKKHNESTRKKNESSEMQNVSTRKHNVSSEKHNESTGNQNISSEKHTESTGNQNGSSEKHNESTGKQNKSSEKKNLSSEKHNKLTVKKNELTRKNNISSKKSNESTGKKNESSEMQNVSTRKHNVSSEKHNESTGMQNVSSEKHNESTGKKIVSDQHNESPGNQNVSYKKHNDSTGKQNLLSEKHNESTGKQNISSEKLNESTGKINVLSKKYNVSTGKQNGSSEKKNVSSEKKNISTGKQNVSSKKQNISSENQNLSSVKINLSIEKKRLSPKKQNKSSEKQNLLSEKQNVSSEEQNASTGKKNVSSEKQNMLSKMLNLSSKMQNVSTEKQNVSKKQNVLSVSSEKQNVPSEKQNITSEYQDVIFVWQKESSEKQNIPPEKQNVSLKKQMKEIYHKMYICELCSAKFRNKEMLLTHRKTTHKRPNLYPIPTILTEKTLPNKTHDKKVTSDPLYYQPNHPKPQTSTSEILSVTQSETLHNVISSVTETACSANSDTITTTPTTSNSEYNISGSGNCVSNNISFEESHQDLPKSPLKSESHELDLQVKRMELEAWKSWKEACDLQVQFWRGKLTSQKESNHRNSSETQQETQRNTLVDIDNFNLKQEEDQL